MAIGRPMAAEVPTARCMLTLHQVMNGTERKPPPAPTSCDSVLMVAPTPISPAVPGRLRLGLGLALRNICTAE
ncbi:hypothetical protein D9M68_824260 [compost metagenome]